MDVRIAKTITLISISLLAGCSSFHPHWDRYTGTKTEAKIEKSYEKLINYTAVVGDPIVSAKSLLASSNNEEYYTAEKPGLVIWRGNTIPVGSEWKISYLYDDKSSGDYILTSDIFYKNVIGVIVKKDGSLPANPVIRLDRKGSLQRYPAYFSGERSGSYSSKGSAVSTMQEKQEKSIGKIFKKHYRQGKSSKKSGFHFELVYAGKQENNIKIVYREFYQGSIRSSFNQELSYNMSESDVISFRSLRIKVINAGNTNIEYQVLEDGNLKWMPAKQ